MTERWTSTDTRMRQVTEREIRRRFRTSAADRVRDPEAWYRDVAAVVHQLRGIVVGEWVCPCGLPYVLDATTRDDARPLGHSTYPREDCPRCSRPFPRRCVTKGCGRISDPELASTGGIRLGLGAIEGSQVWTVPDCCRTCRSELGYKARANTFARLESQDLPPRLHGVPRDGYAHSDGREGVVAEVTAWLNRNLGRDLGACALYFVGEPGRGKSRAAVWALHQALVDRGLVRDVVWHTQAQLQAIHTRRWRRDTEAGRIEADAAEHAWRRSLEAELLVIDDLFTAPPRAAFGEQLADLVRERLDARRPMLLTSNHRPEWSAWFEVDVGRIASRWSSAGRTVEVGGCDWRAAA